ncbi:MAG TPA: CBS domain-containing protein, partial [Actinomycetota bacterium]|nr:CBS domain-containing protein [Actinomycetota bacterium]
MATVRDVMSTDLVTVEPSATIAEAATLMGGRRVGSALVLEGGRLVGILTERDVLRALADHFDAAGHPVAQWMTPAPTTIDAGATVRDALELMLARGFRHLPVTEDDRLVGMVSIRDLS